MKYQLTIDETYFVVPQPNSSAPTSVKVPSSKNEDKTEKVLLEVKSWLQDPLMDDFISDTEPTVYYVQRKQRFN